MNAASTSPLPTVLSGLPAARSLSCSAKMDAVDSAPFPPSLNFGDNARAPFSACQYPVATTTTAPSSLITCSTPATAIAGAGSTEISLPPRTGAAITVATRMPGLITSMPYWALPSTLAGISKRGTDFPI